MWILKKESNFTQLCQSWEKAFAKCHITISCGILTIFFKSQACPNWIKFKLNFCLQVCILTYNFSLESQEKCSTWQYYAILERNFSLEPQKKSSTSQYYALLERNFSQMCQVKFFHFHLRKCIFRGYNKNELRKHSERVQPRSIYKILYIVDKKELKFEILYFSYFRATFIMTIIALSTRYFRVFEFWNEIKK